MTALLNYVEVYGPRAIEPGGAWFTKLTTKAQCEHCLASVYVRYRDVGAVARHGIVSARKSWTVVIAHEQDCPHPVAVL